MTVATEGTLDATIEAYRSGLDSELALLESMLQVAAAQDAASADGDTEALLALLTRRTSILTTLMDMERDLADRRALIASHLGRLSGARLPFDDVRQRHQRAVERLAQIDAHDRRTLEHLARTDAARRDSSQMLDAAEATLTAYRKALSPLESRTGLLDRLG
jgi:hypothetical protein